MKAAQFSFMTATLQQMRMFAGLIIGCYAHSCEIKTFMENNIWILLLMFEWNEGLENILIIWGDRASGGAPGSWWCALWPRLRCEMLHEVKEEDDHTKRLQPTGCDLRFGSRRLHLSPGSHPCGGSVEAHTSVTGDPVQWGFLTFHSPLHHRVPA